MLISFVGTHTRTTMGVGSVTFPRKRPMIDQYILFMVNSKDLVLYFQLLLLEAPRPLDFIQIVILINFKYTLAQTRMGFGRVTLPSKGL